MPEGQGEAGRDSLTAELLAGADVLSVGLTEGGAARLWVTMTGEELEALPEDKA